MSTAPEVATHDEHVPHTTPASHATPAPLVTTAEQANPVVGAATSLLAAYTPGDRFLATPTRTLLAEGVHAHVPHDDRPLPRRVAATLAAARRTGVGEPYVVGAV
ncbi:isochorismate synthase, partial [Streptomyces sp. SID339]|nr:isochorismate synthase [Streptomyces sp. SID339]